MATPRPGYWRDAWVFVILPVSVSLGLVCAYFSGIAWLQALVAPAWNREFGLLESSQHLILLACMVLAGRLAWRERRLLCRLFFALLALVALFVFLEEIDYGLHYYEALWGVPESERASVRGLHNLRNSSGVQWTRLIKRSADAGMVIFFVLLPFLAPRRRLGNLSELVPRRPFAPLMLVALCISSLAHHLHDSGWPHNGSLTGNIGEFRELLVYYVGFLYLAQIWCQSSGARPAPSMPRRGPARRTSPARDLQDIRL